LSDGENSDEVIGETSIEVLLILGENEGGASNLSWGLVLLSTVGFGGNFVSLNEFLGWKVINLDTRVGTNDEPVIFGGEENNVNWGFSIDVFEMLSFNQVPDVNVTIS